MSVKSLIMSVNSVLYVQFILKQVPLYIYFPKFILFPFLVLYSFILYMYMCVYVHLYVIPCG